MATTFDPNATSPTPPRGSEWAKFECQSGDTYKYGTLPLNDSLAISFVYLYFHLATSGLGAGEDFSFIQLLDSSGNIVAEGVCENDGGVLKIYANFYDDTEIGDFHETDKQTIVTGIDYEPEFKYDITNSLAEFRVGGTTLGSADTLDVPSRTPTQIRVGMIDYATAATTTVYVDDIKCNKFDWIKTPDSLSIAMYHYMSQQ